MAAESIESLRSLATHAQRERDGALLRLAQVQLAQRAAQTQAEQLATYRDEYKQRWSTRFMQATSTLVLQCYQGFAGRLDQAIAHQANTVHQSALREQQAQQALVLLEQRVAVVDKLIERRLAEQGRVSRRADQRDTDELGARRGGARRLTESHP